MMLEFAVRSSEQQAPRFYIYKLDVTGTCLEANKFSYETDKHDTQVEVQIGEEEDV
jgi:hypothetical protein